MFNIFNKKYKAKLEYEARVEEARKKYKKYIAENINQWKKEKSIPLLVLVVDGDMFLIKNSFSISSYVYFSVDNSEFNPEYVKVACENYTIDNLIEASEKSEALTFTLANDIHVVIGKDTYSNISIKAIKDYESFSKIVAHSDGSMSGVDETVNVQDLLTKWDNMIIDRNIVYKV